MPDPKDKVKEDKTQIKVKKIKVKGKTIISDIRGHRAEIDNPEVRVGQKVHFVRGRS